MVQTTTMTLVFQIPFDVTFCRSKVASLSRTWRCFLQSVEDNVSRSGAGRVQAVAWQAIPAEAGRGSIWAVFLTEKVLSDWRCGMESKSGSGSEVFPKMIYSITASQVPSFRGNRPDMLDHREVGLS
jgi:hypothetical protein